MLRRELGAILWLSSAPHPAERAFEHRLLHLDGYQAGHQAGQRVVDDGGERRLGKQGKKRGKDWGKKTRKRSKKEAQTLQTMLYLELCHELLQVDDDLLHPRIISFIIVKLLLLRGETKELLYSWMFYRPDDGLFPCAVLFNLGPLPPLCYVK